MQNTTQKKIAVAVHVYKADISWYERISLMQLKRMLSQYPIFLTAPEGLRMDAYKEILGDSLTNVFYFDKKYFTGIRGYNRLMLSRIYYKVFLNFDFILLHHTDAFVFKDELAAWAQKDYDNIGAPIYDYDGTMNPPRFLVTGNGGLSLRKVKTYYDLAGSYKTVYRFKDMKEDFLLYNWRGRIYRSLYYLTLLTTIGSRLHVRFNRIKLNEDVIWSYFVPKYIHSFVNAPFEEALKFGMEFNCDKLLLLNNGQLPFGCHGWNKPIFKNFWMPYIKSFGYDVVD